MSVLSPVSAESAPRHFEVDQDNSRANRWHPSNLIHPPGKVSWRPSPSCPHDFPLTLGWRYTPTSLSKYFLLNVPVRKIVLLCGQQILVKTFYFWECWEEPHGKSLHSYGTSINHYVDWHYWSPLWKNKHLFYKLTLKK